VFRSVLDLFWKCATLSVETAFFGLCVAFCRGIVRVLCGI